MIKLVSKVRVDSDRKILNHERQLLRSKNYILYINDAHLTRKTESHLSMLSLATNGKASDWDTLAKIFAKKITPEINQFLQDYSPTDDCVTQPYGISYMVGCGCSIKFDARSYDLPVFDYGVVAKCAMTISYRTDDSPGGTKSVQTLNKQRADVGLPPIKVPPLVVIADTGVIDVNDISATSEFDMDSQLRYTPNSNYLAGGGHGVIWISRNSKTMNDREFWEFLQTARKTQFADTTRINAKFKSARWLTSFLSETIDKPFNDVDFETRKRVFRSLAQVLGMPIAGTNDTTASSPTAD